MAKPLRFGTALTALGMIGAITACATPGMKTRVASGFGGKVGSSAVGVATRAQAALQAGNFAEAIPLAEKAVEGSPSDAGFRSLLGNAYFGAGRFASAESAYRDSLSIYGNQPQVVLKLALVSIAQGKSAEALAALEAARSFLDPADYGLALALAGRPAEAVAVLDQAARSAGADSRVRQNLALAHALSGDWTAARTVAAQDLAADQIDARVQQWMALATPGRASDQVAALTGFTPAAVDPGQPARLALVRQPDQQLAQAQPLPVPVAEPAPLLVEEQAPVAAAAVPAYEPAPVQVAAAPPSPVVAAPVRVADRIVEEAVAPPMPPKRATAARGVPKPALSPRAASLTDARPPLRRASLRRSLNGSSRAVVQLGAYASRALVTPSWSKLSRKYPALRGYTPTTARFDSAKGLVYRLSVGGFASDSEARDFCVSLKRSGGNCFVRSVAGDAPVRMASR